MTLIQSGTDIWIIFYYIALLFCVFLVFSQIVGICYNTSRVKALSHESWVSKQGATSKILISLFTTYTCSILGIAVAISRIGNYYYRPILCEYTYSFSFMLFATCKICNYYFFLQRFVFKKNISKMDYHYNHNISHFTPSSPLRFCDFPCHSAYLYLYHILQHISEHNG